MSKEKRVQKRKERAEKLRLARERRAGMGLREKLSDIVFDSHAVDPYNVVLLFFVIVSLVPLFTRSTGLWVKIIDYITAAVFIFDYFFRWLTSDYRYKKDGKPNRLAFLYYPITPMAIVDMLSIIPVLRVIPTELRLVRVLRFLKCLRIIRLFRFSSKLMLLLEVFKEQRKTLLSVLGIAIGYLLFSALIMYNVETANAQFDTFFSSLYWATTALTTVGYGDIAPLSDLGKIISMISSLFGIAIIALPSGVITAGFMKKLQQRDDNNVEEVQNEKERPEN